MWEGNNKNNITCRERLMKEEKEEQSRADMELSVVSWKYSAHNIMRVRKRERQ